MQIPHDFILGIGDSDLQVIGEKFCIEHDKAQETIWSTFSKAGHVYENHNTSLGINRYEHFRDDIKLLAELGVKNYRTSVSMSRVLSHDLTLNYKSIEWYKKYFEALKDNDIKIDITLYHWELPESLQKNGGWAESKTITAFLKHIEYVAKELGSYISQFYVLNEPWVISMAGNYLGLHAPGNKDFSLALKVCHNLLLAQGKAIRYLKDVCPNSKIGTVYNIIPTYANSLTDENLKAQKLSDTYFNRLFLDPLFFGAYPEIALTKWNKFFPKFNHSDLDEIKAGMLLDNFGINYYGGSLVESSNDPILGFSGVGRQFCIKNDLGWSLFAPPAFPRGLYDSLLSLYNRYASYGMKEIIISENGTAYKLNKSQSDELDNNDEYRIYFIEKHLHQIMQAKLSGVPVKGYFLWTFMDNFEWAEGYKLEACFGIVNVNRETLNRTPLKSYYWYKNLLNTRELKSSFVSFE